MSLIQRFVHKIKSRFFMKPFFFKYWLPLEPVSRHFGSDRGTPIDRYYIDRFIASHASDIRGDVLEVGDPGYTRQFGQKVNSLTILHYDKEVPPATIVGDLENHSSLPQNRFDCFVCPQTFQYIYDFEKGIQGAYQMLKEGGVLLATLPAICQASVGKNDSWKEYWRFREATVLRGFGNIFGVSNIQVETFGNVQVGVSFYYGFAQREISKRCLNHVDPDYPFIFTVRAVKKSKGL